ncbi:MAG TPA: ParB/RepB/Spo0J family partition protein [Solirubrobacteraceae bacterium]|nr:ParB/RepB/Spo0J family partition protein [Solirubrobacteraceae bacterium]
MSQSKTRTGIGRGLAAILAVSEGNGATEGVKDLPVDLIDPNPHQPRQSFDEEALAALAESLSERGVLQPVLVRPRSGRYELIAGERRWRAARRAGLERIPALIRPTDDAQTVELALIENMAREDLNPVEAARACALLAEDMGMTHEEIGSRVGKSRVAITNLLRLLELPDEALAALEAGALSEGHGRALLMADDHELRRILARRAVREGWSVRTTEERARAAAGGKEGRRPTTSAERRGSVELAETIASGFEQALGTRAKVSAQARGGFRVELRLRDAAAASDLLRRLGALTQGHSSARQPLESTRAGD